MILSISISEDFVGLILKDGFSVVHMYSQISISCTIPSGSPCPPSRVSPYTLFMLICYIRLCDL